MSREVKFRVWSKENEIMLEWSDLLDAPDFEDFMKNAHKEDAYYSKLMQFTGVVDKNGVEVYEGDIVKGKRDSHWHGGFDLVKSEVSFSEQKLLYVADGYLHNIDDLEVIGNIYESEREKS